MLSLFSFADTEVNEIKDTIIHYLLEYGKPIVAAILIYWLGKKFVKIAVKHICKQMRKADTDETVVTFTESLLTALGIIFVIIGALTKLGMPTASMVAALGAAGLAVGLALQGALSNFAAGILIVIFKPLRVGDLVSVAGDVIGHVREITLFTTTITTPENKTAIIPNSMLTSDKIINLTETEDVRVDMVFGCSYGDDNEKVKKILMGILLEDPRTLKDPAPFVGIKAHGASSIDYAVRPWVKADHYWDVWFDTHEKVKARFDAEGVSIPFPQRDVHIVSDVNAS